MISLLIAILLSAEPSRTGDSGPGAASVQEQLAEARELMNQHRYREATLVLQDVVNANPLQAEALFELGNAYAAQRYFRLAFEKWERVSLWSEDPQLIAKAREQIAQLNPPKLTPEAAISALHASAAPSRVREAYVRGTKQIAERDYLGALQSLNEAISADPDFAAAHIARGSANIGLNRFVEAVADYQRARKLDPKLASSLFGLGEAYRGLGRREEARQFYGQYAVSQAPDTQPELQQEAQQKAEKLR
jgi:tetratricopeptide (TPR) repeat protein